MSWVKPREENLNVMLAELLAESGLSAIGEIVIRKVNTGRRMPDVLLDINGIRVIIEGKYPGDRNILYEEACKRLDDGLCDIVMMVEYMNIPLRSSISVSQKDIKEGLMKGKFNVGFVTYIERIGLERWIPEKRGFKKQQFVENVDFKDLLAHLLATYDYVVGKDVLEPVISKLEKSIFAFAHQVRTAKINIDRLKRALELLGGEEGEESG